MIKILFSLKIQISGHMSPLFIFIESPLNIELRSGLKCINVIKQCDQILPSINTVTTAYFAQGLYIYFKKNVNICRI